MKAKAKSLECILKNLLEEMNLKLEEKKSWRTEKVKKTSEVRKKKMSKRCDRPATQGEEEEVRFGMGEV